MVGPTGTIETQPVTDLNAITACIAAYQLKALKLSNKEGSTGFVDEYCIAVNYSAPGNVNLTLADLPGFHNSNDAESETVHNMVQKYIQMDGTLCLHVVKGDQDYDSILCNGEVLFV